MLEWIVSSCLLILAVLGVRVTLGRRISPALRYALWAVVLFRLLVPVQLFTSPLAGITVASPPEALREETIYVLPVQSAPSVEAAPVTVSSGNGNPLEGTSTGYTRVEDKGVAVRPCAVRISPLETLGWLWLAGAAVLGTVFFVSNLRFSARLRRVRRRMNGMDAPVPVYLVEGLPSPCLFGFFHTAVYITPNAAANPDMLRHVLTHELTHYRHLDHFWSVLRSLVLVVHWWNPLVWLAAVCSRQDAELACDAGALRRLGDSQRISYGETLLALVTAKAGPRDLLCCATTMSGEKRSLQKRILQIAHKPKALVSATVTAVFILVAVSVCAFGTKADAEVESDEFWEIEDLRESVDLNRDGEPETLRIYRSAHSYSSLDRVKLEVLQDGKSIWSSSDSYVGNPEYAAYFLCQKDGQDCLLEYTRPRTPIDEGYSFRLFYLNGTREVVVQESNLVFSTVFQDESIDFDPGCIASFLEQVNDLLADSTPVVYSRFWQQRLAEREDGTLYDNILVHLGSEGYRDYSTTEELVSALKIFLSLYIRKPGNEVTSIGSLLIWITAENIGDISGQDQATAEELAAMLREAVNDRALSKRSARYNMIAEAQAWNWTEAEWIVPLAGGGKLYLIATTTPGEVAIASESGSGISLSFYESQRLYDVILAVGSPENYPENELSLTPDLDHDGTPDRLYLSVDSAGNWCLQCLLGSGDVWQESSSQGAGQDALFRCQVDGEDYLLRYSLLAGSDRHSYNYKLFSLNQDGREQKKEGRSLTVLCGGEVQAAVEQFDVQEISAYLGEVNALLADSTLLVNGNLVLAETFEQEGRLYDSASWLEAVRQPGDSLFASLVRYQNRLLAQAATPTLDEVFSQIRAEDILSVSSEDISAGALSIILGSAAKSPRSDGRNFQGQVKYMLEASFTREGDSGEQMLKLEAGERSGLVRATVTGQVTAVQYSENPSVSGTYLHDTPYQCTEYLDSIALYTQLLRYAPVVN